MALKAVSLDDKYTLESGRIFVTGIQALVRLPMLQHQRDAAAGHRTAGFISGYRGSPLGGLDLQLGRAQAFLKRHEIRFLPGVNEDLAATSVWGTQQAEIDGEGVYDGVFAMWYGKGPGVDRSGDAFRHGNLAGSSRLGGVLVLMGDDHACESSTTAHQSEYALVDAMMPILNPAGVQDILDFGLYGWALSRYSGCWVGLKCVHDTVEASASIDVAADRVRIAIPDDFEMPEGGLNIRWPDTPPQQEQRLHGHKLKAAQAFCRVNQLDRTVMDAEQARLGVVTTGKSYLDVRRALTELDIDAAAARRLGLRLYKVGMSWPLEPTGIERFSEGLEQIVVVEEKRGLIEEQIKSVLYGREAAPRVVGKRDETGATLFPSAGRLGATDIARAIGRRLLELSPDDSLAARLGVVEAVAERSQGEPAPMIRTPYFCAGCPHNTSTRVPQGSKALAGIGCHYMAQWMDRETARFTQMGGEGASWIGEALFSTRKHVFQNIGDGTYYHSGLLAVRAAVAAGVNITFKLLYNDAVAMTGGQPMDGPLTVPQITQQLHAEGVVRTVVVTDEPEKYPAGTRWAPGVVVRHRDRLDAVQRELRQTQGTTALVYDQTCAAEKRRRRKRGQYPDPDKRVFIYDAVCEGCGDCGLKSNCVAILPLETPLGRKRAIDQSACNKDYSCVSGFCPSFVTVHGGAVRRRRGADDEDALEALPEPSLPALGTNYGIVLTGVGGTGVITVGALLGMAAHVSGMGCSVLDMTGLAQKGGAVMSHIILAARPEDISATHVAVGGARLLLGCDLVVAAGEAALTSVRAGVTEAVVNTFEMMTGEFTRDADRSFPGEQLADAVRERAGNDRTHFLNATELASRLLGDSLAANIFLLGYAYQKGFLPLSAEAIDRAIELNGQAVDMNRRAFRWGRRSALDLPRVETLAGSAASGAPPPSAWTLESIVEHRSRHLVEYQDAAYADRYRRLVHRVAQTEARKAPGMKGLAEAVARCYFKLLAYKDEYEVARLYAGADFLQKVNDQFEGDFKLEFSLAPPFLARRDPVSGEPRKRRYGPWIMTVFRWLARLRRLRGTAFDPFGWTRERRTERRLIEHYEKVVAELCESLQSDNHGLAVRIASIPEHIRGFGPVKLRHLQEAERSEAELLEAFRRREPAPRAA